METQQPIDLQVEAGSVQFRLHLFENRDFKPGGDEWILTQDGWQTEAPPNDEVAAMKFSGDIGVRVELFNDANASKSKTWGDAQLTSNVQSVEVPNLRNSSSIYVHHKIPDDDNLDGKVSKIVISN